MFQEILNLCLEYYYHFFNYLIIYPILRILHKKFNFQFLNLGYLPTKNDDISIEELPIDSNDPLLPHIYLYEKTLSVCPAYPHFQAMHLLEIGCGHGGGLAWIKKYIFLKYFFLA